ncbi:hypothetical protein E2542_SST08042 [Spatholobus suberectus]|nr:hypothetical protein E2542_SST08042 [Spatholobus suberectus]
MKTDGTQEIHSQITSHHRAWLAKAKTEWSGLFEYRWTWSVTGDDREAFAAISVVSFPQRASPSLPSSMRRSKARFDEELSKAARLQRRCKSQVATQTASSRSLQR